MFGKKKVVKELTHDAVMGDLTQTHEHLLKVDAENQRKLEEVKAKRATSLKDYDDQIAALEAEQEKIEKSKRFFSVFESGRDVLGEVSPEQAVTQ